MTDLPSRLPAALTGRLNSVATAIFNRQGREVDVAIAGIPFLLADNNDLPESIETVTVRKDQVDTEQDPGEQSLSWWWRRSQASFHGGEGLLYEEAADSNAAAIGYYAGRGIDVFTQGRVTLLKRMLQVDPGVGYSRVRTCAANGGNIVSAVTGGKLVKATLPDDDALAVPSVVHAPSSPVVDGLFVATGDYFDITQDGTLYASNGSKSWSLGGTPTRLQWGKGRLWVIGGPNIWQPDVATASGTSQTPVFTNPNPGWNYTCMAEGPGAMYFGGHDGSSSSVQAITFDSSGGIPTLSGAAITAALPDGELVQELTILAGTFFGIGTNRGFRVGQVDVYSNAIDYGPILFPVEGITACTALTAQNRFFVVAFATDDNESVAYRVDTSVQLDNLLYPYAHDIAAGSGHLTSLATSPDGKRLLCTASGDGGVWLQSTTKYVDSGWLQTGRIRYRTTELKAFKYLAYEAEPLAGTIVAEAIEAGGGVLAIGTQSQPGSVFEDQYAINLDPARFLSLRFTFSSTEDHAGAPVFGSYLLKALPAVKPQRLITLPLRCYDYEQARSGQRYGGDGYASDRLTALQQIEDAGDTVTYQDFSVNLSQGRTVIIDSLKFVQTSPAPPFKTSIGGPGGILQVQLRTVD
jgi:hypothetical protein